MSLMRKYLFILLFLPCLANAESWDTTDKILGTTALAVMVIDWGQTRYIAQHPGVYYERNPLLGRHPSVQGVDLYFASMIVGSALFANYLSSENRKLFLGTVTAIGISVTAHNRSIGIKIAF